jgi:ferrochelatase
MKKLAVVLFNLGGPDRLDSVRPFLFNLFNDPAIIDLPRPARWLLAQWISRRREAPARKIYEKIGGKSPLVEQSQLQADALEERLRAKFQVKVFLAMRYWHPMSGEAAAAVKVFSPDEIVLLPLYPQFSTTTTGTSLREWNRAAEAAGLRAPTHAVCCYPTAPGMVGAQAKLIGAGLQEASRAGKPKLLFSAHGLPQKIIDRGDPYQEQIERTAAAVVSQLKDKDLDWSVCYQSRVGRLRWTGPSIEEALEQAAKGRVPVVVVPISFVSEHSETLVELDITYLRRSRELTIPAFIRVPALAMEVEFIDSLVYIVEAALRRQPGCIASGDETTCSSVMECCLHDRRF